jgi:DNA invertase Pin-like site-specific DNA recombinase
MTYILYRRVSTDEQKKSGLGLEAQERDIELFLQQRPGEVIASFTDTGSGADNGRPEFEKAVQLAKKTGATLVVSKLDRLSRRVSKIAELMETIHFKVASMPDADEFQLHIYAALAEQERKFISLRTKAALQAARERGTKLGGYRAGGMKKAHKAKVAHADAYARKVASLVLPLRKAGLSLSAIAIQLGEHGVPTSKGGQWDAKAVSRVIDRMAHHARRISHVEELA